MIFNMVTGGGSAQLNFSVVAYASEDSLPQTAKENTIGVITNTEINGYAFSATEPENPIEGMVWVKVGGTSAVPFSVLKNTVLMVYPVVVSQYISGAWVTKTAQVYQNDKWNNMIVYLFYLGNQFESITGGWEANAYHVGSVTDLGTPNLDMTSNVMNISRTTSKNAVKGSVMTVNAIDLTDYNKLYFNVTSLGTDGEVTFGITDAPADIYTMASSVVAVSGLNCVDISDYSGSYTVAIHVQANADTTTSISIDSIYLQ